MGNPAFRRFLNRMIIAGIVIGSAAGVYGWWASRPAGNTDGSLVHVTIPQGSNQWQIAQKLEQAGVIRDAYAFSVYMRFRPEARKSQAGEYDFLSGSDWRTILDQLINGRTVEKKTFTFTVPEGFTVRQIADRLVEKGIMTAADFEQAQRMLEDDQELPFRLPSRTDAELVDRMEGYLFPQTYTLLKEASPVMILDAMRDELARQLRNLPDDWQNQLNVLKVDMHEMLTVASLVEREVVVPEERAVVAGVIYNRLRLKMPLQIDATIQYTFPRQKERLIFKDLETEHPYNTYRHPGLPPGPIANPGLEAIKAALYPATTKALFYVTKKDGTQGHYFAETFEEHRRNISKSKQ